MTPTDELTELRAYKAAAGLLARQYVAFSLGSLGYSPADIRPGLGRALAKQLLTPEATRLAVAAGPPGDDLLAAIVATLTAAAAAYCPFCNGACREAAHV